MGGVDGTTRKVPALPHPPRPTASGLGAGLPYPSLDLPSTTIHHRMAGGGKDGEAMTAITAPDFRVVRTDVPRLRPEPGTTLSLMVLAADATYCAGVDLDTGVLVRAWSPAVPVQRPRAYDIVDVTLGAGADGDADAVPDPAQPEAIVLAGPPQPAGSMPARRAERLLRPLLHPADAPLLSSHGPTVPFWERRADHPSIALVEPLGPVRLHRDSSYLACRFPWLGVQRELPCLDRRVAGGMDSAGQRHLVTPRRTRLVVALTPPIDGHCHKVVEAVLPHP